VSARLPTGTGEPVCCREPSGKTQLRVTSRTSSIYVLSGPAADQSAGKFITNVLSALDPRSPTSEGQGPVQRVLYQPSRVSHEQLDLGPGVAQQCRGFAEV